MVGAGVFAVVPGGDREACGGGDIGGYGGTCGSVDDWMVAGEVG